MRSHDSAQICMLLVDIMDVYRVETTVLVRRYMNARTRRAKRIILEHARRYSVLSKIPRQEEHLGRLVNFSDIDCISNLRMDRNTFGRLCRLLVDRAGLRTGKVLGVEEQLAIFLSVLSHHQKNRIVRFNFVRSGSTVSYYVNKVLAAILSLHTVLIPKATPVTDDCNDHRWKWFKVPLTKLFLIYMFLNGYHCSCFLMQGCLGALDGTHINVLVGDADKPRYRNRKGQISTNTLAACDRNMQFVFFYPGWEGSAGDSRVLRDAVAQPDGFKVPQGLYVVMFFTCLVYFAVQVNIMHI